MPDFRIPCARCAGTGWDSHGDRHAETIMDRCRECGGAGTMPSRTGETREGSFNAQTGRPYADDALLWDQGQHV